METITDYFFNHFNNISNNRLVHIEMDSYELSRILFQKNTELRISCEALGGTTLYQDLINFDRRAQFDKDDIYIASTEKSYELFKRLYESNKILDLYETNPFFKTMTFKSNELKLKEEINPVLDKADRYVSKSDLAKLQIFSKLSEVENLFMKTTEKIRLQEAQVKIFTDCITNYLLELELIF